MQKPLTGLKGKGFKIRTCYVYIAGYFGHQLSLIGKSLSRSNALQISPVNRPGNCE